MPNWNYMTPSWKTVKLWEKKTCENCTASTFRASLFQLWVHTLVSGIATVWCEHHKLKVCLKKTAFGAFLKVHSFRAPLWMYGIFVSVLSSNSLDLILWTDSVYTGQNLQHLWVQHDQTQEEAAGQGVIQPDGTLLQEQHEAGWTSWRLCRSCPLRWNLNTWKAAVGVEVKVEVRGVYYKSAWVSSPHMVLGQPWLCNCRHDCILDYGSCSCPSCEA